jgi:hypothetical protein
VVAAGAAAEEEEEAEEEEVEVEKILAVSHCATSFELENKPILGFVQFLLIQCSGPLNCISFKTTFQQ